MKTVGKFAESDKRLFAVPSFQNSCLLIARYDSMEKVDNEHLKIALKVDVDREN